MLAVISDMLGPSQHLLYTPSRALHDSIKRKPVTPENVKGNTTKIIQQALQSSAHGREKNFIDTFHL